MWWFTESSIIWVQGIAFQKHSKECEEINSGSFTSTAVLLTWLHPHRRIVELEEIEADKVVKDMAPFLCQPSHEDFTLGKNQLNGHEVK